MSDLEGLEKVADRLAASALLADPGDKPSLEALAGDLEALLEALPAQTPEETKEEARAILDAVKRFLSAPEETEGPLLEEIQHRITALLEGPRSLNGPGGASTAPSPEGRGDSGSGKERAFHLPEWADQEVFQEFLAGSKDALAEIEAAILALEKDPDSAGPALKRKVHTLKGEAGVLGLEELEKVCHELEDHLEAQAPTSDAVDRLLSVKDWISSALDAYARGVRPDNPTEGIPGFLEGSPLQAGGGETPEEEVSAGGRTPAQEEEITEAGGPGSPPSPGADPPPQEEDWDEESVSLAEDFLAESEEGLSKVDETLLAAEEEGLSEDRINSLFRVFHTIKGLSGFLELQDITELAHTTEALLDQARKGSLQIEGPVLDVLFDSTETMREMLDRLREAISRGKKPLVFPGRKALLERLKKAAAGKLEAGSSPTAQAGREEGENPVEDAKGLSPEGKERAHERPKEKVPVPGAEPVEQGSAPPRKVSQDIPARKKAKAESAPSKLKEFVKVDLQRVDTLVALIGELVIAETMVVNAPELAGIASPSLRKQLGQMSKITSDLQDIATRMRMVPVRDVFQKMARMVRDLSRKTGKAVKTEIEGATTEIDRGMVEQLGDPLVHIIRNAVDHGIEPPEEREAAGKPRTGTIYLKARHQGGNVVIEVADDGKGLDRKTILEKAQEKGLVKDGDSLSDQEVFNLIFAPGFSTAKKLTEISGRGVGMDVVKRNIESIRGSVSITSTPGRGTSIQLILPLTMAIIDGMLVTCGKERYIIPTLSVVESIKPEQGMIYSVAGKKEVMAVRGETFPLFRLDRLLGIPGAVQDPLEALVVIVESQGRKVGILVDDVLTQQQVVIKGLGNGLPNTGYLSGAAILSDGRVGLILNMAEIVHLEEISVPERVSPTLERISGSKGDEEGTGKEEKVQDESGEGVYSAPGEGER